MTDESSEADSGAEETAPESTPNARSPGAMIRSARERARISVEDLATQIKLARPTLEALERDDFNQLLEPVYVRGYYRKCAKVLGLAEKDLIDAYQGRAMPKAPVAPSKLRLASGTELGTDNRLPMSMAIGFAVVAVVLCILFWQMGKTPQISAPPVSTMPADVLPVAPSPETGVTTPMGPGAGVTDAAAPIAPITSPATPEAGAQPAVPPAPGAAPATPATALPQSAAAQPAAAPAGPTPAQIAAAANAPDGAVTLQFTEASWARVEDAAGKVLLADLQRAGDSRTLKGKLPFTVFLGNGPGVSVEFEGKPVDFSGRVGENLTARFQVPPKS